MVGKKTLVLGASLKPSRYSNLVVNRLVENEVETEAFGLRKGKIGAVQVRTDFEDFKDIHTITLYVGPDHQPEYFDRMLQLQPKRVIFNPGTQNPVLYEILEKNGIEVVVACTLVLLATRQY